MRQLAISIIAIVTGTISGRLNGLIVGIYLLVEILVSVGVTLGERTYIIKRENATTNNQKLKEPYHSWNFDPRIAAVCTFDRHILLQKAEKMESHRFRVIHGIEFQKYKIEKLVLKVYIRSFMQMSNEIVEIMSRVKPIAREIHQIRGSSMGTYVFH